jgi:hypothetical protein
MLIIITCSYLNQLTDHGEKEHRSKGTPEILRSDRTCLTVLMRWHRHLQVLELENTPLTFVIRKQSYSS